MKGSEALSAAKTATEAASAATARTRTDRFHLSGPTTALDRRVHAARRDIADIALAGRLFAPRYAQPELRRCAAPSAMLRGAPDASCTAVSQLLAGEEFAVLDQSGGWAWGYCLHDHYVGYVEAAALSEQGSAPTHIISAPRGLIFSQADIKSPVVGTLPMGAGIAAAPGDDSFVGTGDGFIHRRHIRPIERLETDPVTIAERLIGVPYVWGGRAGDGLDCSGLVQLCLGLCGIAAPRDSDQQRALGRALGEDEPLRRGDLLFFPGHVGMMVDSERMIHANAFWMAVAMEPLVHVVARLTPEHTEPIVARRRIAA